ncbi:MULTISPECIES: TRAP transporter substrate-binding protein DctP [unclassified Halorhodospira]|uniref:TRAP transporter substrate-binding protein DctP n=1 Tax=unclassified Halorhodospira TaxID=2626748 RepID=UPI001EE8A990|nr:MULTISPECIES: TRAP transporter substrate-binding protein DctP [unclassified Halorhodospira]MCG5541219.1 TRAP transporter substrate-binding protein DctP [Halorhodospira sp. M39old]MCG5545661.1 TRAP transporter substrate-binding protein DctP [Halorhodospira sp. M38]
MRHRLSAIVVAAALAAGCGDEPPEQWRIALEEKAGGVQYEYAARFAEEVEERTDGAVEVRIYPYGAIGDTETVHQQVRRNAVHFAFGSGDLAGAVPESQVFGLHFIYSEDAYVNARALNDPELLHSDALQGAYRDARLRPLALVPTGWRVWAADRPLRAPADFRDVRLGVADSPLLRESYRAYGAQAEHVEYGELHAALADGRVDATAQPIYILDALGLYEHTRHWTAPRAAPHVSAFVASDIFYQRLSRGQRRMLREIGEELVDWAHEMQQALNEQRLAQIRQAEDIAVEELDAAEREALADPARPLRALYTARGGPDAERILARLLDALERAEAEHGGD